MFLNRVIRALERHGVKYALVGGYAVALHGAVRGTADIDIVVALSKQGLEDVEAALTGLGLESRLPVTAADVHAFREEYINNRNLTAWSFVSPRNPLEMVDVLITEDVNAINTVTKRAFDMSIRVAAIADLIAIKRKAGRPQDLEDIRALQRLS